jgi:high-affinity iron transporter
VAASLATALGLNLLVSATQGRAREILEGGVMLAAAGVLFYVSYWLISQVESRRWTDFLKRHARQGAELGGYGTLGLTAFLAIYREGAETALMYQGLIADQRGAHGGLLGVGAGLADGLVLLAGIYAALRSASVRCRCGPSSR